MGTMDKRFWAIIGVIAAVFIGIIWVSGNKEDAANQTNAKPTSHVKGKADSKVKLVEYGDFQCSFCGQYYPIVEQVTEKYKDQISFQFINLPLSQTHPNAFAAARAAEAADEQGKYWEMYNLLFQNQNSWGNLSDAKPTFRGYAQQLALDMKKYDKDYASTAVNNRVNADIKKFNKTKMEKSTPTFLLNGKQIMPKSVDEFSKLIDEQLKKNQ
jgi:protein-disulfide isomerase